MKSELVIISYYTIYCDIYTVRLRAHLITLFMTRFHSFIVLFYCMYVSSSLTYMQFFFIRYFCFIVTCVCLVWVLFSLGNIHRSSTFFKLFNYIHLGIIIDLKCVFLMTGEPNCNFFGGRKQFHNLHIL